MDEILTKKITSDDLTLSHVHIISIQEKLEHDEENVHENRTAKLWKITKAQRTGNWLLHPEAISECLLFFASTGHYLYPKSAYAYLQSMNELPRTNPDVYQMLMNGHHVVWRFRSGQECQLILL